MNESELLQEFLNSFPESFHQLDEKRFVRWAVAAHRKGIDFPTDLFYKSGMNENNVDYYLDAYRFVGYTLDVLDE